MKQYCQRKKTVFILGQQTIVSKLRAEEYFPAFNWDNLLNQLQTNLGRIQNLNLAILERTLLRLHPNRWLWQKVSNFPHGFPFLFPLPLSALANFCSEATRRLRLRWSSLRKSFGRLHLSRRICIPHHLCPCVCALGDAGARGPWFTSSAPAAGTRDQPHIYDRA